MTTVPHYVPILTTSSLMPPPWGSLPSPARATYRQTHREHVHSIGVCESVQTHLGPQTLPETNYDQVFYRFLFLPQVIKQVLARTSSGGFCGNDGFMHMTLSSLPFGGVGRWLQSSGLLHGCIHPLLLEHANCRTCSPLSVQRTREEAPLHSPCPSSLPPTSLQLWGTFQLCLHLHVWARTREAIWWVLRKHT